MPPENDMNLGQVPNSQQGNQQQGGDPQGNQQAAPGVDGNQNNNADGDNNAGENPLGDLFWNGEGGDADGNSPSSSSKEDSGGNPAGTQQQQQQTGNPVQTFQDTLNGLPLSDTLISPEIHEALTQGDYKGLNKALQTNSQETVKQAAILAAQMTQEAVGRMRGEMGEAIKAALGQHQDTQSLESSIPSAQDPAFKPIVQGLFAQAMKQTGDREKAIVMTKNAMAQFSKGTAQDSGVKLEGDAEKKQGENETDWSTEFGPLGR